LGFKGEDMALRVDHADLARMRDQLLFDGTGAARKLSRFWVLPVLAAVIASAGIVADSTATVIGAMIVAPLMTPILGTILAVVTGDRANLARAWRERRSGRPSVGGGGRLAGRVGPLDQGRGRGGGRRGTAPPTRRTFAVPWMPPGSVGST
jgi:hypothetical protein